MIVEGLKRIMIGVAVGSLITFAVISFMIIQSIDSSMQEIWKHWLASMLIGILFSFASAIFEREEWSILKQTVMHSTLTFLVLFPIIILAGWLPFNPVSLIIGLGIFLTTYSIMWVSMYFYYKNVEKSMNKCIDSDNK
ncbi:Protein of unknown function [Gracilibacillus orientalis]|uniref:DUF3021 domain-containing protein n=1 Tax=Gracilibacillus orientalis TaxID=334253 RepID=A0A1I4Q2Y6_9BACI|nr:DUF3021 domain-containing protein [Gracilibacillus orientalis]SFM34015.1 Protein of unknown function [Gracilibacillus orientalis]